MTFLVIVTTPSPLRLCPVFFVNSAAEKLHFHWDVTPLEGVTP